MGLSDLSKTNRIAVGIVCALGVVGLTFCAVLFFRWFDLPSEAGELEEREATARRLGIPLAEGEVDPRPKPTPEQDALPIIDQITVKFQKNLNLEARLKREIRADLVSQEDLGPAFSEIVELADSASGRERLSLPGRISDEENPLQGNLWRRAKAAVLALCVAARSDAQGGNTARAIKRLDAAQRLSRLLADPPGTIFVLASGTAQVDVAMSIAKILPLVTSDEELQELDRIAKKMADAPPMIVSARGEAWFYFSALESVKEDQSDGEVDEQKIRFTMKAMRSRALKYWIDAWPILSEAESDYVRAANRMARLAKEAESESSLTSYVVTLMSSIDGRLVAGLAWPIAYSRLSQIAVAVRKYQLAHGHLPPTLGDANVDLIDPLSNAPIRYRIDKDGYRVWSVGPDLEDDGGPTKEEQAHIAKTTGRPGGPGDWVLAVR